MDYDVKFDIRFMTIFNLVANGVKPKKEMVVARKDNDAKIGLQFLRRWEKYCNFLEESMLK